MIQMVRYFLVMAVCGFLLTVSGCATGMKSRSEAPVDQEQPVTCIGVMPATTMRVLEEGMTEAEKEGLQSGVATMDLILARELGGIRNIRFVDRDQIAGLRLTGGESALELARLVGKSISCSAVLETVVRQYTERVGGRYSAETPAHVAFEMRLIDIASGYVLWSAKYDEVQKPVMENLYELSKARSRKFTWVTAEELMNEGVRDRFSTSPYFQRSTEQ